MLSKGKGLLSERLKDDTCQAKTDNNKKKTRGPEGPEALT